MNEVQGKKRRKGPSRRDRDRNRAAAFQACHKFGPAAAASCDQPADHTLSFKDPVVLPFTGKIIPFQVNQKTEATTVPAVVTTPYSMSYSSLAAPLKASRTSTTTNLNVMNSARKNLFLAKPPQPPPSDDLLAKNYKQKEEKLWTKLFMK